MTMKTARLGKTDLIVSEVGFGGIPIVPLGKDEAISVVRHCFEIGINFFDTAHMYHDSEEKIGAALSAVRDDVVLATKTMERQAVAASTQIELSLQRLQTDRIDLYQLHNVSSEDALKKVLAPGGAYEAVDKARREGKVRYAGISSHNMAVAAKALKTGLFQTLQFPFNFIEKDPADELFPLARQLDIGIIGMKPLGGGLLEPAALCFGFLQRHPDVIPIPGIRAKAEADEIVGLYREPQPLSEADRTEMDTIREALGKTFCHRCEYCMPCEQGVQISSVLIYPAFVKRFSAEVAAATPFMQTALKSAQECIECGQCEERCPYDLPIIDLLKENLSLYRKNSR
jgi:predicted aldo/keto reductase-like oxidoreductase